MITNEYRTQMNPVAVKAVGKRNQWGFRNRATEDKGSSPKFCGMEITSAGRERSLSPAATSPLAAKRARSAAKSDCAENWRECSAESGADHLKSGAQKKTVLGPAGEFHSDCSRLVGTLAISWQK